MPSDELFSEEMKAELLSDTPQAGKPSPEAVCQCCGNRKRRVSEVYVRVTEQSSSGETLMIRWRTFSTSMCGRCNWKGQLLTLSNTLTVLVMIVWLLAAPLCGFLISNLLGGGFWPFIGGCLLGVCGFILTRILSKRVQKRLVPWVLGDWLDSRLRMIMGVDNWSAEYVVTVVTQIPRSESAMPL